MHACKRLNEKKLPLDPKELHEYYERYIEERGITDKKQKHDIWWAMFYCAKECRKWVET